MTPADPIALLEREHVKVDGLIQDDNGTWHPGRVCRKCLIAWPCPTRVLLDEVRDYEQTSGDLCGKCGWRGVRASEHCYFCQTDLVAMERAAKAERERDELRERADRLQERLDQFDAYGYPNVAAALDERERLRQSEEALIYIRDIDSLQPGLSALGKLVMAKQIALKAAYALRPDAPYRSQPVDTLAENRVQPMDAPPAPETKEEA